MTETESRNQLIAVEIEEEEEAKVYPIKHPDLQLLDTALEKTNDMLGEKGLRAIDRQNGYRALSALLGIGKEGEIFQDKSEEDQKGIMIQAVYAQNLPQLSNAILAGIGVEPPLPAGPSGPQLGFVPMGPGMGGGMGMGGAQMRPPAPTPPGGYPPYQPPQYPPQYQPQMPPHLAQPPAGGYAPYPPQPGYSPGHDPYGQGYAQPHPYPSYPAPQGYPPQYPGAPPAYPYPPIDPATGQPYPTTGQPYPPQPGYPPQPQAPHPAWPPVQPAPVVVDAEISDADKKSDENA